MDDEERLPGDAASRAIDAPATSTKEAHAAGGDDADEYMLNDVGLALRIRSAQP